MSKVPAALIRDIALDLAEYRDDEEFFLDTLDGETDIVDLTDALLIERIQAEEMAEAIKAQEARLRARRMRIEGRAEAAKRSILLILQSADLKKIERPLATVSRRAGAVSVKITDEEDIPSQMMIEKITYTPDKKAIKAQLDAGEKVPGAELVRGEETIMIRGA
jgi:hypothetical protein